MQDAGAGGFSIAKNDRKTVKAVELRAMNAHKASRQGQWDYRSAEEKAEELGARLGSIGGRLGSAGGRLGSAGGRLGSAGGRLGSAGGRLGSAGGRLGSAGGRIGSSGFGPGALSPWDDEEDRFDFEGKKSRPQDRDFLGAEWW
jgi:hypothetical protein